MTNTRQYLINWADKAEAIEKRTIVNTQDIDFDWHADHVVTSLARNSFRSTIKLIRWAIANCNYCNVRGYVSGVRNAPEMGGVIGQPKPCPHCTPFLASLKADLPELP